MPLSEELLALQQQPQEQSWIKDLIAQRYQPKTERLKRTPVGFNFNRDPFDPSSYYKQLGQYRDISTAATAVVKQEAANREAAEREREQAANQAAIEEALRGINPWSSASGSDVNVSRNYKLGGVKGYVSKAADYFGSKYGIRTVYGVGPGSVPGSDHPHGKAVDLMINNLKNGKRTGTQMANDIIQNYQQWNVKYVIWNKYIWSPSKGWRKYSGPSDHTDHVHVSFN